MNEFRWPAFEPEWNFFIAPFMTLSPRNSLQVVEGLPAVRRAKIVCTLGPGSRSPKMVDRLMQAGMDVVRLNFSHGTPEEHGSAVAAVRAASARYQRPIAILADLQGPKIRTGPLVDHLPVCLVSAQRFTISTAECLGDVEGVSTTYKRLPAEVRRGNRILLADGLIELRVESVRGPEIICRVVNGGELREHQGINLPGVNLRVPALTPKDLSDMKFALQCGVNYIGVSFVRRPEDVLAARAAIKRAGKNTPIIAKLEKPAAIDNLDAILEVADGVMVARGDLGVEMDPERVPVVQKLVIARAREARVPVITATQMLESMRENPRPTRAEASDVANAIFDGSDAVMLSAETATGLYPVESVCMMDRIIRAAENSITEFPHPQRQEFSSVAETTAELICHASNEFAMKVIAVFTETGTTARLISKNRPKPPIIAFSHDQNTRRQISLLWGVLPRRMGKPRNMEDLSRVAEQRLLEERLVSRGDVVGIVAGTPIGVRGSTNFMKFHVVGGTQSSR
jgi:pyruvate kinase